MPLAVRSASFSHQGAIPSRYTCDGKDSSPPLEWSGVPAGTKSLALIVDDPDAPDPDAPQRTWVHWVLFNIPAEVSELPEGVISGNISRNIIEGLNDWNKSGYGGPCPPTGRHRYFFKLYALDTELPETGSPTKQFLEKSMKGHILAEAELIGTYKRR